MVPIFSFSSRFLSDSEVDRSSLDETLANSDRDSFEFQLIDIPAEESDRLSDVIAIEPGESGTDAETEYFAAQATAGGEEDSARVSDDWYFISTPTPESTELPAGSEERIARLRPEDVEKDQPVTSLDRESTHEDVCLLPDVVEVPEHVCELLTTETSYRDEICLDTSISALTVCEDIPSSTVSDVSLRHAASATGPSSQMRFGETAVLPPREEISSPLVTSSSMLLAAVEVCQSSSQLMSSTTCQQPIYAHPDVVSVEPSFHSDRPIVSERERTHDGDEQRVSFGAEFPSESGVEEMRLPDGTIVRRRVIRTRVRRIATRRVRRRQPDGRVMEYTETFELPEDGGSDGSGSGDGQLSWLVGAASAAESGVTEPPRAEGQQHVVGVQTDTSQPGEPQVHTDVEVVRETLPDGRVAERRIVRTRQRRTLVKRVVVRPDRP